MEKMRFRTNGNLHQRTPASGTDHSSFLISHFSFSDPRISYHIPELVIRRSVAQAVLANFDEFRSQHDAAIHRHRRAFSYPRSVRKLRQKRTQNTRKGNTEYIEGFVKKQSIAGPTYIFTIERLLQDPIIPNS